MNVTESGSTLAGTPLGKAIVNAGGVYGASWNLLPQRRRAPHGLLVGRYVAAAHVALGNAIGSCIFNILAIMGIVAIVKPIAVPQVIMGFDLWVMLGVTVGFVVLALALPRIGRLVGVVFLLLYGAYVYAQFAGYSQMMQSLHTQ